MPFEFFNSGRYLRAKQKQAFISLITALSIAGVTVGVMALIVVIGVMSGFEADLKARILGANSHLIIMRDGDDFVDYHRVAEQIRRAEDVEAATPFVHSQVMIRSPYGMSGAILRGVDPESAGGVTNEANFTDGAFSELARNLETRKETGETPGIILGKELAGSLEVGIGDMVYLISPRGMLSPMGHLPAMKRFKVSGMFESGMYEYDGSYSYVHISDAQRVLRMGGAVTGIDVKVTRIYDVREIGVKIIDELGAPYWGKDWKHMNRNLFSALKLEKTVMSIILTLIVLVAAFNIASSLIMMVMEKTRDIAVLKAMGATDKSIRRIFVFKGMAIGFMGTILGVGLGFLLCTLLKNYKFIELPADVFYIPTIPVRLESLDMIVIACAAMAICFLATLYPAQQASKLNPIEAFRYG